MKTRFWNVGIEIYGNGIVNAAVLRSRDADTQPSDKYKQNQWLEAYSLWFGTEADAKNAVNEALAMNVNKVAAA